MNFGFEGNIIKIEEGELPSVENIYISSQNEELEMSIEILKELIDFKEGNIVQVLISKDKINEDFKLVMKGRVYSILNDEKQKSALISFGGLRCKIVDKKKKINLAAKSDIYIGIKTIKK